MYSIPTRIPLKTLPKTKNISILIFSLVLTAHESWKPFFFIGMPGKSWRELECNERILKIKGNSSWIKTPHTFFLFFLVSYRRGWNKIFFFLICHFYLNFIRHNKKVEFNQILPLKSLQEYTFLECKLFTWLYKKFYGVPINFSTVTFFNYM